MKVDKWVNVIDGAGREVRVRRVDAREIEEGKAARAKEASGWASSEPDSGVVYDEADAIAQNDGVDVNEVVGEVDDQSVAPKVVKKAKAK